jgi:hypothetical protein
MCESLARALLGRPEGRAAALVVAALVGAAAAAADMAAEMGAGATWMMKKMKRKT